MKNLKFALLVWFSILLFENGFSQPLLSENFQQGIPGTWTLINNDGATPDSTVSVVTSAWVVTNDIDNATNIVAVSTSKYNPSATADDWLITPAISINANSLLTWKAKALDAANADGYEVRISTTTATIPGFMAHLALFSTSAESASWTKRSVDLAAKGYSNQTIYIAFRNNSTNKYLLALDDVAILDCATSNADAGTVDTSTTVTCSGSDLLNLELEPINNAVLAGNIYNGNTSSVLDWSPLPGRPFDDDGSCCASGNPPYEIVPFQVSVTGSYSISQHQSGYDGVMLLYTNPLNLAQNPAITFVAGDDDSSGTLGVSALPNSNFPNLILNDGQVYYLVSTGYETSDFGNHTTTFSGPGNIYLSQLPQADLPYDYNFVVVNSAGIIRALGDDLTDIVAFPGSANGDTFNVCGVSYMEANLDLTGFVGQPFSTLLSAANSNACVDVTTACHRVIIYTGLTATVTGSATICEGESVVFTASGGISYVWSTEDTVPTISVNPPTTSTYTVTVTNASGCTAVAQGTATVFAPDGGIFGVGPTTACEGDSSLVINLMPEFTKNFVPAPANEISGNTINILTWAPLSGRPLADGNCCSGFNPVYDIVQFQVDQLGTYSVHQFQVGYDGYVLIYSDPLDLTQNPPITFVAGSDDSAGVSGISYIDSVILNPEQVYYLISTGFGTADFGDYITTVNGPGNLLVIGPPSPQYFSYDYVTVNSAGNIVEIGSDLSNATNYPGSAAGTDYLVCGVSYVSDSIDLSLFIGSAYSNLSGVQCLEVSNDCYQVKILSEPVANAGTDDTICPGTAASIQGNTPVAGTGKWTATGAGVITNPNSAQTTVTGLTVGLHELIWTLNNGHCTDSDTLLIFVGQPTASAGSDTAICIGSSAILTASTGISYLWSTNDTTPSVTVTPSTTSVYSVTVTDAGGCTASTVVTVTINPLPLIGLQDASICAGSTIVLDAENAGATYSWSTGATTQTITVSPPTTASATVVDANGCVASDTATVTVSTSLTVNLTNHTICNGDSITLNAGNIGASYIWSTGATTQTIAAKNDTTYSVTVTDANNCTGTGSSAVTLNLAPNVDAGANDTICFGETTILTATGAGNFVWSNGVSASSITVGPTTTRIYRVTISDVNGCTAVDSVLVVVNPVPNANAGPDISLCNGGDTLLIATGGLSYNWNVGATDASVRVSPLVTTTYTVTITDANACVATDSVKVTVDTLPIANAGLDQDICIGENATLNATGGVSYAWSLGVSTASVTVVPTSNATYTVTVTNAGGCSSADSVTVGVYSLPVVTIDTFSMATFCVGTTPITLNGTPAGGTFSGRGVAGSMFNPAIGDTGLQVIVYAYKDGNGCTGYDSTTIIVDVCVGQTLVSANHEIKIYPNPTHDVLFIELPELANLNEPGFVRMFDMVGKMVFNMNLEKQSPTLLQLSVGDLPSANYWLVVNLNGKKFTQQITKSEN